MARLLGRYVDGSPEWLAAREGRIGGSDLGVIMGWSVFETRTDLLARKRGELAPRPSTPAMERGHYLEDGVARWFSDQTGLTYSEGGSYLHDQHDWALANPDRFCSDGSLLEVKTAKAKDSEHGWGRAGTDQVPLSYGAQAQWYLGITGRPLCHLAVLFGAPFAFYRYKIKFAPATFDYLLDRAEQFHQEMTMPTERLTA